MSQATTALKYKRSGETKSIKLFNVIDDVASPRACFLYNEKALRAPLVLPSDPNASYLRMQKDGVTYAIGNNAFYEPSLTGLTKHYSYIQSSTNDSTYYIYYYFHLADEFRAGNSSSASTATDSYIQDVFYAGGSGGSGLIIYGWSGTDWVTLISSSYTRTLLQGAGSTTRTWYWHATAFAGYSDFRIRISANHYSSHTMNIVLRNEIPSIGNEIKSYCQGTGLYGDSGLTVAGKTDTDEYLCGRVVTDVTQNGDAVRVGFSSNSLSKRGNTTWHQFLAIGDPVVLGSHGPGVLPNFGQRVAYVSNIYYPPDGTETGGYVDLKANTAGTEALTLINAGSGERSVWKLNIGDRVVV